MNGKPKQDQYKFSLSVRDKHSKSVKRIVEHMRQRGILSQAVRDGLRLINDLRLGKTKVLLELFPDIVDKLCPPSDPKEDINELKRMIQQLQQQQAKVVYVPSDGNISEDAPLVGQGLLPPPPKPSKLQKVIPLPVFDDDDTLAITQSVGKNGENFTASLANMGLF